MLNCVMVKQDGSKVKLRASYVDDKSLKDILKCDSVSVSLVTALGKYHLLACYDSDKISECNRNLTVCSLDIKNRLYGDVLLFGLKQNIHEYDARDLTMEETDFLMSIPSVTFSDTTE